MLTLKQLSELPRETIKIIDRAKMSGYPLTWMNHITIIYNGFSRNVRRSSAFQFGLCDGVKEVNTILDTKPGHGGKRPGAGRKPLPYIEAKTRVSVMIKNVHIEALGGEEEIKLLIQNLIVKEYNLFTLRQII